MRYLPLFLISVAVFVLLPSPLALAQQPAATQSETLPDLTRAEVEQMLERAQQNTALAPEVRDRVVQLYTEALDALKLAETWRSRAQEYITARETAPERIAQIEETLAADEPVLAMELPPDDADLDSLSRAQTEAERLLNDARARLDELNEESSRRAERRRQIPDLIAAARQRLTELQAAPSPPPDSAAERIAAHGVNQRAQSQAIRSEIAALNEELASYEARSRLLVLRIDEATVAVDAATRIQRALQERVAATRQLQAQRAAEEARERLLEASNAPAAIRAYAEQVAQENANLAEQRTGQDGPLRGIERAAEAHKQLAELRTRIVTEFDSVRKREEAVGLNDAVGQLLRRYRANLPSRRTHLASLRLREQEIGEIQLKQIDIQESRSELANIGQIVESRLAQAGLADESGRRGREQIARLLRDLLTTKRDTLDALLVDYERYLNALLEMNVTERAIIAQRDAFANFIDERVLWIRSGDIIGPGDIRPAYEAVSWLVDWRNWRGAGRALWRDIRDQIPLYFLAVLLALALAWSRPAMKRHLAELGDNAAKKSCAEFMCTVRASLITFTLVVFPAALLLFLGWRLTDTLYASDFTRYIGAGAVAAGALWLTLEFPRQVLRDKGLADAHFAWPKRALDSARNTLTLLLPIVLPLAFLISIFENQDEVAWRESLGQLLFIALMTTVVLAAHALLRLHAPFSQTILTAVPGKRREGVRRSLYWLFVIAPAALALAAAGGYYYTAIRLVIRLHASIILALIVLAGVGFAFRAILIARRKLAIEQSRKRRAELRAAQKKAREEGLESADVEIQEPALDLSLIDVQTKRLTRSVALIALFTGLWFTWAEFVPALGILDQIAIPGTGGTLETIETFNPTAAVSPDTPPGNGAADTQTVPAAETQIQQTGITLFDLFLALLVGILTVVAFRNLPGLLEIALLQRLPLAQGERYAITTVLGYVLIVIGIIIAMGTIGIQWSNLQWLVAALGLGIGFGLQEIVANFVSGLIILFEQPIRLGDVVTVGNISGTVTRIRIRATTVTDWDRKELIVPNKEFITGQLVNWSLTDPILRLTVPVGVAYASDTALVRQTLTEVAHANGRVLDDPPSQILFLQFADSYLLFEVRVFIASIDDRLPVQDELHHAITKAFREKGIEIAFPQRDLHLRTAPAPLTIAQTGQSVPAEIEQQ